MHTHEDHSPSKRRKTLWIATAILLILAALCYAYATAHSSHIAQALTWGLILACPLMHLFGHGGHGGHRHGNDKDAR